MSTDLIVTTSDGIEGARVTEYLGIVRGLVVRRPTFSDGMQALGGVFSGNPQAGTETYAKVCEKARSDAYQRMLDHAKKLGADAIIAMRYESADIGNTFSEVLAYGTAVKLIRNAE